VGVSEAQAIAAALHEVTFPRPMTHDLMANLLGALHARVDELLIHDLVDGTYYGLLHLTPSSNGGDPLLVDTRPSDGLALALRAGATIRVAAKILDETPQVDFLPPDEGQQVVQALGLTVVAPDDDLRRRFSLPDRPGLVVLRVTGAGEEAGLHRGDLLLSVEGVALREPYDLLDVVRDLAPGREVALRYWRDGAESEVHIVLAPPKVEGPKQTA
jgi:bifunctional DNase/RNase